MEPFGFATFHAIEIFYRIHLTNFGLKLLDRLLLVYFLLLFSVSYTYN
jgi:hypothetical protein